MLTSEALRKEAKRELARKKYLYYVKYVHKGAWKPYPHVKVICDKLEDVISGKTKRLMIFVPPQHGKSMTVTETFPSYILGRFPDKRIIEISYNDSFAVKFGMRNKDKVNEFGKELFGVETSKALSAKADWAIAGHRGGMLSVGIGGGITGNPADIILIDDPVKNLQEANSLTYRNRTYEEFQASAMTRLQPDGAIIIIQTRWHEDDLSGRILENQPGQWEVLSIPAICESEKDILDREIGEPIWIDEAKGRTREWYEQLKTNQGSYLWSALYQQRPSPVEGALFKREWWQFWKTMPGDLYDFTQSWDCAFKDANSSDFVVGQVWARSKKNPAFRYLLDQVRGRMTFTETVTAVRTLSAKWKKATRKLIEDKANGTAVIDVLKKEIPGLIAVEPKGGKVVRAQAVTALVEAGNVYIPDPSVATWVHDFIEETAAFPTGAHDDQVDATTQALMHMMDKSNAKLGEPGDSLSKESYWKR
jgi:predicted phage terminase large subunit-like protein